MRAPIIALALAFAAVGCGPQFDPSSKLNSLRILGVTKTNAAGEGASYARPGETVNLTMLWHDASKKAPRTVRSVWVSGCFDPPGDLYYGCFQQLYDAAQSAGAGAGDAGAPDGGAPPSVPSTTGVNTSTFSVDIPTTLASTGQSILKPSSDPTQPDYGLAYVFFAICAGNLGTIQPTTEGEFPVTCTDAAGNRLGSDDFVAGYSSIYVYDGYRNKNAALFPTFSFNGKKDTPADCTGDECVVKACSLGLPDPATMGGCNEPADLPVTTPIDCGSGDVRCIPHCNDDGGANCPEYGIKPNIDRANSDEIDEITQKTRGETLHEQMWVRYFATDGSLKSQVRLVNDAKAGWNEDYGTSFRAPKKTGPVTVWAVVQDNRGGASWSRLSLMVQ